MKDHDSHKPGGAVDAPGPRFKKCDCGAVIGRTTRTCPMCDHKFVGHNKARELRKAAGEPVRRGRKPKHDLDAPEPEAQLLALAEPPMQIPAVARFVCTATKGGGLQLCWPDFDVRFTLTPGERMILRGVA